ncbi:MAG: glycosyltransferase family 2 protein [Actinomycetota bacterium]|nr:glycosyltransferase family 2 protein [Actinomycetota bacterium]
MKLSAVIIAVNEESIIEGAIASCAFADEVLVVDGGSTDGTVHRAKLAGARIVERPFDDFARQRTFALAQARGEWVLFVDADERVSRELHAEVNTVLRDEPSADCYTVPRRNMALGQWLDWHFGGADAPRRLVRRDLARYPEARVHEVLEVTTGRYGALKEHLVHLTHRSVGDLVDKINRYAELEAADAVGRGARQPSTHSILASFPKSFWRYWRSGLRKEGTVGAIEAVLLAFNRTLVEIKIWERHRNLPARYAEAEVALQDDGDVAR